MPWRNGGGTTTEIAIDHGSSPGVRFVYRVSIADVASDGPFSRFDGYDRHIVLLRGAGMTLDAGPHGRIELRPLEPQSFSGDWDVEGRLVSGPVQDYNVIVDRARASASLVVKELDGPEHLDGVDGVLWIAHVLDGSLKADGEAVDAGDTIVTDLGRETTLAPRPRARIALSRILLRA